MSSSSKMRQKDQKFQELFDPKSYLETSFRTLEEQGVISYIMKCLQMIFSSENVKGHTLLDIGTGPSLYTIIPATYAYKEIILSDIACRNINALQEWIDQDPKAFDWKPYIKYHCDLLKNGTTEQDLEADLRVTIKGLYNCDVFQSNPLQPVKLDCVDAISSTLCLDSACNDLESYRECMFNMASLLKPGGWFILVGFLNSRFYIVGKEKFTSMFVTKMDVVEAVNHAGLNVVRYFDELEFEEYGQREKVFVLLASKPV